MPQDRAQRPQIPGPGSDPSGNSGPSTNTNSSIAGTYFLGRYRVVDEIGIGGMASVHLARMDGPGGFQKWVAIKRIHPHLVEDDSFVHMFLDEARIAARISHPNVASVFELGKHEDTYWIAMEYLHGEPLREVMRRTEDTGQPMPPEIACRVIADAAEGLHAAHELLGKNGEKLGLVHRDVTPHNLFVTYDGTTKVVDFGIAKFSSRMASTRAGTLKGKLAYMSPEQVAGEQIDRRTDLFALGVVLWELTTGQRLFRMESDLDTLAKVQECNVPRPTQVVRGYPLDLEKIVMKALAKNKNERYKTAREFSRALQSLLMRRGLFIASDEVAGYVQAIFVDRIRKREEHLRWAAEVTQTINIDSKLESTPGAPQTWNTNEPSVVSYNSEVQPSPQTVRGGPLRPAAGAPPAITPPQPSIAEHFSRQSQPTNARPGASMETVRPPAKPQPGLASTQATAAAVPKAKPAAHHPGASEPPTMRASPQARDEAVPVVGDEDDYDDTDDTIVTSTRPDFSDAVKPTAGPLPAAGRPPAAPAQKRSQPPPPPQAAAFSAPPRSVPPRVPTSPPLPAVVLPTGSIEQGPASGFDQTRTAVGESPFQQPLLQRSGSMSGELPDPLATARSHAAVEVQRLFAPPPRGEQRTMTAASLRGRNIPLWAIAGAAAFFALVSFAVIVFILLKVTARPATPAAGVTNALNTGPLDAARSAFAALLGVQPVAPPAPTSRISPEGPGDNASTAGTGDGTGTSAGEPSSMATVTMVASAPTTKPLKTAASMTKPPPAAASSAPAAAGASFGSLTIVCKPACEQVMDGGSPLGPSPIYKRKVGIGGRRVTLVWTQGRKTFSTIVMADQEAKVFGDWP